MLLYVKTNLFKSPAQVLVNTVNTVGVMGKGIALQFKKLYPEMFTQYQRYCEQGLLTVGKLWLYKTDKKWILNFPTKRHWRQKSKLEDIEAGLQKFVATYEEHGIQSIAFPQLGVGNGGLDWERQVRPLMEHYLAKLPIDIYIHLYNGQQNPPEYQSVKEMRRWLELEPRSLSLQEFEEEVAQHIGQSASSTVQLAPAALMGASEPSEPFMVLVDSRQERYAVTKEDIADFWLQLRDKGIISSLDYPQAVNRHHDIQNFELIMTQLPYIIQEEITTRDVGTSALVLNKQALPVQTESDMSEIFEVG